MLILVLSNFGSGRLVLSKLGKHASVAANEGKDADSSLGKNASRSQVGTIQS